MAEYWPTITLSNGRQVQVSKKLANSAEEAYRLAFEAHGADTPIRRVYDTPGRLMAQAESAFGVPVSQIETVPALQRAGAGLLSDTGTEEANYYQSIYPGAQIAPLQGGVLGILPQGQNKVLFSNAPGLDRGDIAQLAGGAALPTATTMLAAPAGLFGMGAAAGLSELGREGLQKLVGTQDQAPGEIAARAGLATGLEAVVPGIKQGYAGIRNAISGASARQGLRFTGGSADDLARILLANAEGAGLPLPAKGEMMDEPISRQFAAQTMRYMGRSGQARAEERLNQLRESAQRLVQSTQMSQDAALQDAAKAAYERDIGRLAPAVDPRGAGEALIAAYRGAKEARKNATNAAYAELDTALGQYNPTYDLSQVKQALTPRNVPGLASDEETKAINAALGGGAPTVNSVRAIINAAPPERRLSAVAALTNRLDDSQDFRVVQELRRQVGSLYEPMSLRALEQGGVDKSAVTRVYDAFTQAMEKPQGVSPEAAKELVAKSNSAAATARDYFRLFDTTGTQSIARNAKGQSPELLWGEVSSNPQLFSSAYRRMIEQGDQAAQDKIRASYQSGLFNSADPLAELNALERGRSGNPELVSWLFPTQQAKEAAYDRARQINELRASVKGDAYRAYDEQIGYAQRVLGETQKTLAQGSRGDRMPTIRRLVQENGGVGSQGHDALRSAVWESIVNPALKINPKTGEYSLEPKALKTALEEATNAGWTKGIFTDADRITADGLLSASRRMWRTGDAGVGLTVAAHMGAARQGDLGAGLSIWTSRYFANMLSKDVDPATVLSAMPMGRGFSPILSPRAQRIMSAMIEPSRVSADQATRESAPPTSRRRLPPPTLQEPLAQLP